MNQRAVITFSAVFTLAALLLPAIQQSLIVTAEALGKILPGTPSLDRFNKITRQSHKQCQRQQQIVDQ